MTASVNVWAVPHEIIFVVMEQVTCLGGEDRRDRDLGGEQF